nr:unnamed protein product [Digitaria exilis]
MLKQEAPCLILGLGGADETKASVFSLADRCAATVRASDPSMRGHLVLGSSGGWLVTADEKGALRMANPVTGAHADLPPITTGTIPFCIDMNAFRQIQFAGVSPSPRTKEDDGEWGPICHDGASSATDEAKA